MFNTGYFGQWDYRLFYYFTLQLLDSKHVLIVQIKSYLEKIKILFSEITGQICPYHLYL